MKQYIKTKIRTKITNKKKQRNEIRGNNITTKTKRETEYFNIITT